MSDFETENTSKSRLDRGALSIQGKKKMRVLQGGFDCTHNCLTHKLCLKIVDHQVSKRIFKREAWLPQTVDFQYNGHLNDKLYYDTESDICSHTN